MKLPLSTVTCKVSRHEEEALKEHIAQFFVGQTPAMRAAEARFADSEQGMDSLSYLISVAKDSEHEYHGLAIRFLLSLHFGEKHLFNLSTMLDLDEETFEHCTAVIRMLRYEGTSVFTYFKDGVQMFERLGRYFEENLSD